MEPMWESRPVPPRLLCAPAENSRPAIEEAKTAKPIVRVAQAFCSGRVAASKRG